MLRVIHDDLRVFLNARLEAEGPDAEACYRILLRTDDGSDSTPNYFMAIPNPADTKRAIISYSTDAAMTKHQINRASPRQVWNTTSPHRTNMRVGRWIRAMTDIEDGLILDALTVSLDGKFGVGDVTVELLEGEAAITKAYLHKSHCTCEGIGDLANSCMRYEANQGSFALYGMLGKLAVVTCKSCGKIQARAMAWDDGNNKYIDRRYGTQQNKQAILNFATANGYTDIWPGSVGAKPKTYYALVFTAKLGELKAAPYLDSLPYWCRTCETISNMADDCYNSKHDYAQLRGTRGTDHQGWWGKCPDCGYDLDQYHKCRRKKTCMGCGAVYCGTKTCPNECIQCDSCGTWRRKDQPTCPSGCIVCPMCHHGNQQAFLNQSHGLCDGCGHLLIPDSQPVEVQVKWDKYGKASAVCPHCKWNMVANEYSPMMKLEKCEHVHNGPYNHQGGHCPSCHHHLVMLEPKTAKPEPKPKPAVPNYEGTGMTFTKYNSSIDEYAYRLRRMR